MAKLSKQYLDEEIRRLKSTLAGLRPSGDLKSATEEYIKTLELLATNARIKDEKSK